jgi:hypothetical protein
MAKFTLCTLPDGRNVYVNVERATFVVGTDDQKNTLIGFGNDINEGIVVDEGIRDVLSGQALNEH